MAILNPLENSNKKNKVTSSSGLILLTNLPYYIKGKRNNAKFLVVSSAGAGAAFVNEVDNNAKNKKTIPKPNVK